MRRIVIKNLGPIKDVTLDLNRLNVIMGPQSSGKSVIAKVISYCTWLDKKFATDRHPEKGIRRYIKELQLYHRLSNGYFNKDTQIYFNGEFMELWYNCCPSKSDNNDTMFELNVESDHNGETSNFRIQIKQSKPTVNNSKIIYIPAERNFVSAIYNLQEYLRDRDNIQDFVINWYEAKRKYSDANRLNILNLDVEYYTEGEDMDKLHLASGEDITLQIASSGLQAVVPLVTMFDYVTQKIYTEQRPMSVKELDELQKKLSELVKADKEYSQNIDVSILLDLINSKNYQYSQIIVEEPEQNLFPHTQKDLVYYMLQTCNDAERNHRLTITTHSPYILYALNNCMMGYLIKDRMPPSERETLASRKAWFDPKLVSVWEIDAGKIRRIQDKDGIISKNYFDSNMTALMDEYYQMLNYYDEE
jgi:hypothetical protein